MTQTQKVMIPTGKNGYGETYKLTTDGNNLLVTEESYYQTKTTRIPCWWNTEEDTPLNTLNEVLNSATIAEDGEHWTDQEFWNEYNMNEAQDDEEMQKFHKQHTDLLRATRIAFPNVNLHTLHWAVECITTTLVMVNHEIGQTKDKK